MDAHRLLIFREIARVGSIGGAARALGWTQPAVSQHLRALERQAGLPLVVRRPRGVRLTEAGEVLLRHSEAIATRLHAASDDLAALTELRSGTVRLAAFPSANATLVPAAIELLATRHPDLDVRLREAQPPEALDLLQAGAVDVVLGFAHAGPPPDEPGLVRLPLGTDPIRLVLPRSRPEPVTDLAELAAERWIAGCERCTAHLLQACADAGFAPDVRHSTDDYMATQALVARGLGVALLPRLALTAFQHPDVVVRDVPTLRPCTLHLLHHREADQIPAVRAAVRALRDVQQMVRTVSASGSAG